jgi:hypothetical protein
MKPLAYVMLLSLLGVVGCDTKLPKFPAPDEVKWLSQNWTPQMWDAFYHTPQGTEIIPYAWFMALEQPSFSLNPMAPLKLFSDADYLARFGFLPSATSALNPDQLPVGFVKDTGFVDPATHEQRTVLALTCAACHTGQLEIINNQQQRIGLRIDGGGAMVNPTLFEAELGCLLYTSDAADDM